MEKKDIFAEVNTDEKQARVYRLLQKAAKGAGYKNVGEAMHAAYLLASNRDMALESQKYRELIHQAHLAGYSTLDEAFAKAASMVEDAHRYSTLKSAVNVSYTFFMHDPMMQALGIKHMIVVKGNMGTPEGLDELLDCIQRGEIPDLD